MSSPVIIGVDEDAENRVSSHTTSRIVKWPRGTEKSLPVLNVATQLPHDPEFHL